MVAACLFVALAQETATALRPVTANPGDGRVYLWAAIAVALIALALAFLLARAVIASDAGTAEMQVISNAIREGAEAFLKRQYQTIGAIALVLAVVVFLGYHASPRTAPYALKTVISFLVGAVCSGLAGFTGMYCSIRANIRAASAARSSARSRPQARPARRSRYRPRRRRSVAARRRQPLSALRRPRPSARPFPSSSSASASAPRS